MTEEQQQPQPQPESRSGLVRRKKIHRIHPDRLEQLRKQKAMS